MSQTNFSGVVCSENGFGIGNAASCVEVISEDGLIIGSDASYVADGAIALTDSIVLLDGTSATVAATLADGTEGQTMMITAINVDNAVTVVPANLTDGTTITFDTVNDAVTLVFVSAAWKIFGNYGTVVS